MHMEHVGVVAPRTHGVRTVAMIMYHTLVHHPKMPPPKQPIQTQKTFVASTPPVSPGFLL